MLATPAQKSARAPAMPACLRACVRARRMAAHHLCTLTLCVQPASFYRLKHLLGSPTTKPVSDKDLPPPDKDEQPSERDLQHADKELAHTDAPSDRDLAHSDKELQPPEPPSDRDLQPADKDLQPSDRDLQPPDAPPVVHTDSVHHL